MQTVKDKLAENFGGPAQGLGRSQFSLDEVPSLEGKVAIVTGGSEGKPDQNLLTSPWCD